MGNFFADTHKPDALEKMRNWKELTSHRAVGEGLTGGLLAGLETGNDRCQSIFHERKLFVTSAHRVAFALDLLEPRDQRPKLDVFAVTLFVCHQEILSQSVLSFEL